MDIVRTGRGTDVTVIPAKGSEIRQKLFTEDIAVAIFASEDILDITIDDYILIDTKKYILNNLPVINKKSTNLYEYQCIFEAYTYDLTRVLFKDQNEVQSDFYIVGDGQFFMDLLKINLIRVDASWTVSLSQPSTDTVGIQFVNENCLQALKKIADTFELEYEFTGYQVDLVASAGSSTGLTFLYKTGIRGIKRETVNAENIVTVLFGYGSDKNLTNDYRGGQQRLIFQGKTAIFGAAVENYGGTPDYGKREGAWIFEDIYPHLEAEVTSVDGSNELIFSSTDIDFDINSYLLSGTTAKVIFLTGDLAGYTFEIAEGGYDHATKTITLLPVEEPDRFMPNSTLKPATGTPGDMFTLVDIEMPGTYITAAETELEAATEAKVAELAWPRIKYVISPDWAYFRTNTVTLEVGDFLTVTDADLNASGDIRIIGLRRSLVNDWSYTLELSDFLYKGYNRRDAIDHLRSIKSSSGGSNFKTGNVGGDYYTKYQLQTWNYAEVNFDNIINRPDNEPNGFLDSAELTVAFVDGTRTLTLTPVSSKFTVYVAGVRYDYESAQTKQITDTEGKWYFYFDADGLQATQSFSNAIVNEYAFAFDLYWDALNNKAIFEGERRHGIQMDGMTHLLLHKTDPIGYVMDGGLEMTGVISDGDGSLDTHIQAGYSVGYIFNADILQTIAVQSAPASLNFLYLDTTSWREKAAQSYLVIENGGLPQYNPVTAGSGTLTVMTSGKFILTHLIATNDVPGKLLCVVGQNQYDTIIEARRGSLTEMVELHALGLPMNSWTPIATFVIEGDTAFTNSKDARVVPPDDDTDYIDWRYGWHNVGEGGGTGSGNTHFDSTPDADHTVSGLTTDFTAGESLVFGDVCYVKSDGKAWKADSSAYATAGMRLMATATIAADASGVFLLEGFARDDSWSWTVGTKLVLSETAGAMTGTIVSTSLAVSAYVGEATASAIIYFSPELANAEVE